MWKIFYMIYILNQFKNNNVPKPNLNLSYEANNNFAFKNVLEKYIGQTVTVFLKSGGYNGSGYTGILMKVNKEYISIYLSPISIAEIPISKIIGFSHNIS